MSINWKWLTLGVGFGALSLSGFAQSGPVAVADGRTYLAKPGICSVREADVVTAEVKRRSQEPFLKKRLNGLANGKFADEFEIRSAALGCFTKAGVKQVAVLYRYSYTNGVVILHEGTVVAHYSGDPGDYAHYTMIRSTPDLNRNGLSEFVLFRNVEDTPEIFAYIFEQGKFWGQTNVYDSNVRPGEDPVPAAKIQDTAYVTSATPGQKPGYSRVTYVKGQTGGWKVSKPATPVKLEKRFDASLKRIDR